MGPDRPADAQRDGTHPVNIQTLRDAYYTLPGTPALPETPSTLYSDINTMEQVQWSMYELWRRNAQHSYTGEICAGQTIGVI